MSTTEKFFQSYPKIELVRLQWIDYSGVLRARIITKQRCIKMAESGGDYTTLAQNCMVIPISTAPRCWPDGIEEWHLIPDWESLMPCGSFVATHASVMCYTVHTGISDRYSRCPRWALQRVLAEFQDQCPGSQLLMGFEIEFVLLDSQSLNPARSLDHTVGYSMMAGLRNQNLSIIEEIVMSLSYSSIPVHHFHVELVDQYEIALGAMPPMQAIDKLVAAMEAIRTIALRHGLKATMTPKPVLSGIRNGCHVHFSMAPDPGALAPHFLAGVLSKLKALCAFGMPNYDSYCRVVGDCAGEWVGWGTNNKDLPIRGVRQNRWEFRFLDATANMYLFAATVLSAGMAGIRARQPLNIGDCQVVPSSLSREEAAEQLLRYGITERMPTSMEMALDSAKNDQDMETWIGSGLLKRYLNVKQKEVEHFENMTDEARRKKFLDYF